MEVKWWNESSVLAVKECCLKEYEKKIKLIRHLFPNVNILFFCLWGWKDIPLSRDERNALSKEISSERMWTQKAWKKRKMLKNRKWKQVSRDTSLNHQHAWFLSWGTILYRGVKEMFAMKEYRLKNHGKMTCETFDRGKPEHFLFFCFTICRVGATRPCCFTAYELSLIRQKERKNVKCEINKHPMLSTARLLHLERHFIPTWISISLVSQNRPNDLDYRLR